MNCDLNVWIMNKYSLMLLFYLLCLNNVFSQDRLPNIIYIYADDLGYGSSSTYGNKLIQTPNLDKMASEGIKFTQHYTGAPVCAPARCILLTGKHAGHSYIRGNYELGEFDEEHEGGQMPLPHGIFTLPHMLKGAGYVTGAFGKWGLGMPDNSGNPNDHGFDYFFGLMDQKQAHGYYPTHLWRNDEKVRLNNPSIPVHTELDPERATDSDFDAFIGEDYGPELMLEEALSFMDDNYDKPFFLFFPSPLPHPSLQVPASFKEPYLGQFNEPAKYYGEKGYAPVEFPYSSFAAMITYLDMQVGQIIQKVKDLGLEEETLIMFSSDNGATLESGIPNDLFNLNGGLRGFKRDLYEGGIRVPFIVKYPGKIKAGEMSDLITAQYDLMPTLAELIGVKLDNTDGISFLPTLFGQNEVQKTHDFLYWEFGEKGGSVAVRMGEWKGVKNNLKKNIDSPWEIYNLNEDLSELKDISVDNPEIIKMFDKIVEQEHMNAHIRDWEFINPKFKLPENDK